MIRMLHAFNDSFLNFHTSTMFTLYSSSQILDTFYTNYMTSTGDDCMKLTITETITSTTTVNTGVGKQ